MRKAFFGVFVVAVLLLARGPAPDSAVAQGKKGKEATGYIEIGEGKDGKFRFFVRDDDDKLLAMSSPGGFATVKDAQAGIETLKQVIGKAKVSIKKGKDKGKDKDDK